MTSKNLKNPDVLTWVFFASQGITDNTDLMRCMLLCQDICRLDDKATVENIKDMTGYRSCLYDIPSDLISDEKIQEMITFKL